MPNFKKRKVNLLWDRSEEEAAASFPLYDYKGCKSIFKKMQKEANQPEHFNSCNNVQGPAFLEKP